MTGELSGPVWKPLSFHLFPVSSVWVSAWTPSGYRMAATEQHPLQRIPSRGREVFKAITLSEEACSHVSVDPNHITYPFLNLLLVQRMEFS